MSAIFVSVLPAHAQTAPQPAVFAHSGRHNVDIAYLDPSVGCQAADLHLTMVVTSASRDIAQPEQQLALANVLGRNLSGKASCATVQTVDLAVIEGGSIARHLVATRATGWAFSVEGTPSRHEGIPAAAQTAAPAAPSSPATPAPSGPPAPAVSSAPVTPVPAQPAPQPAPDAASSLPEGYMGVVALLVQAHPERADDPGVQKCWAAAMMTDTWRRAGADEFRRRAVQQDAGLSLKQIGRSGSGSPPELSLPLGLSLGEYDFGRSAFPLHLSGGRLSLQRNCYADASAAPPPVANIVFAPGPLDLWLPLPPEQASAFIHARSIMYGSNRAVMVVMKMALDRGQIASASFSDPVTLYATLIQADVFTDQGRRARLGTLGADTIAQAIAERAHAEQARQAHVAEEQHRARVTDLLSRLGSDSKAERLALWVARDANGFATLSSMRDLRVSALLSGDASGSLLVQASASGRKSVGTSWPGYLNLTLDDTQPALSRGGWYLVRGTVSVPDADGFKPAEMRVAALHACRAAQCSDADDPRSLAAFLSPDGPSQTPASIQ